MVVLFWILNPLAVVTSEPPTKQSLPDGLTCTWRVSLIALETILTAVEVTVVLVLIIFLFLVFEAVGGEDSR